jgi:CBS domain-containing protein
MSINHDLWDANGVPLRNPARLAPLCYSRRSTSMNACDVMTKDVVSVSPDTPVAEMARLMLEKRISGLPVLDRNGNLVGIVTEGDCLRRTETGTERKRPKWLEFLTGSGKLAEEYIHSHGRKVSEVMTHNPVSVDEETSLTEIVHLMETRRIKRVPVVRNGKVVGIVSRANLLHALVSVAHENEPALQDDRAIRERVFAAIAKLRWLPRDLVNVVVKDGVVDLWGTYMVGHQDEAIIVAAENVPGVKAVRGHLCWIDPMSGIVIHNPDEVKDRDSVVSR